MATIPPTGAPQEAPLLDVRDLRMHFPIYRGFFQRVSGYVKAVDGVSFSIRQGETLGLVGESGCGKTTVGRSITRAHTATGGEALYTMSSGMRVNLFDVDREQHRALCREVRMVFQDPNSSLNPRMTVMNIVANPLRIHDVCRGKELEDRVADLLRRVGLQPEHMRRYPHAFSGGQRQRIGIARALALEPRLVIADEPVSALDVSVQAQVLNLLHDLQQEFGLTYLFISHDLSVVKYVSDRVAVMYVGKLVETAPTAEFFENPLHPYAEALLSAVPKLDPDARFERIVLEGDVPDPSAPPPGCYFHPRCRYARERCREETPALRRISGDHHAACHYAEELSLRGITA